MQTGAQRIKGVELSRFDLSGFDLERPARRRPLRAAIGTSTASDQGFAGHPAVNVPRNTVTAWRDQTFPHGIFAGAGVRCIDPQYGGSANIVRMPSVMLVDAALHLDLDRHRRFSVNAANPFNRVYANCQAANFCADGLRRNAIGRATYLW